MPVINVNDIKLYYETHGEGEPLVLIHGLGSSTRDWEYQVPAFAGDYRVITLDLRGHGRSDKPAGPYSMAMFAADTAGLLEALDAAPAHIVGMSLGGMAAFQLAADRPDVVKSMVILNSGPELMVRTFRDRLNVFQRFAIVRLLGMRRMGKVLAGRMFPKPEHEAERAAFVERWAVNDPKAYEAAMRALINWSVKDRLGEMKMPVLVAAADQDYTPVAVKEAYVELLPDARLVVIPDSRHATPAEQPEAFNAAVRDFLAAQG